MRTYQTVIYRAIYVGANIEWEAGEPVFESAITTDPSRAVQEMDFYEPIVPNWFLTMKSFENGKLVEEEWFDCSMVALEY